MRVAHDTGGPLRIIVVALVALILSAPVTADAGVSVARKAAQALRIAKRADKRSSAALAAVHAPAKGQAGAPGVRGATGPRGPRGLAGQDGSDGNDGHDGAPGNAPVVGSVQNSGDVTLALGTRATVVEVSANRESTGEVLVTVEGQMNGENDTADHAVCEVRKDGVPLTYRTFTAPGKAQVAVSASALIEVPAGTSLLAFTCKKDSEASVVTFPAERTRMTVVG